MSTGLLWARRVLFGASCLWILAVAAPVFADSKNPAEYPLRLHIYTTSEVTFYHNRFPDETKGDGRANLFESGEPRGVDFSFDCAQKIKPSFGYETYPAKWKKQGEELLVLFPVFGKANSYFTCALKTRVKDYAYFMHNGRLDSEPPEQFKRWMTSHDYDPEHGKNTPAADNAMFGLDRLETARRLLTGEHKDVEKAKALLFDLAQNGAPDATPEQRAWACIYLGYIADRAKERDAAVRWYQKAAAVDGIPSGSLNVARSGLRQPLVWIRHLDAPGSAVAQPPHE